VIHRRTLLLQLLGLGAAGIAQPVLASRSSTTPGQSSPFKPLLGPIPLPSDGLSAGEQQRHYKRIGLLDRLQVPEGYRADVLLSWGDQLGEGVMGFNNDYLAFTPLGEDRGLLTINFEYISARSWCAGYADAHGVELPFSALAQAMQAAGGSVDVRSLPADDQLRTMAEKVATAAMADLGIGVASLSRSGGSWRHQATALDRRIDGLQGLHDPNQQLRVSGPAAAVFRQPSRLGYDDGLGDRVIGSFANCSGGQTPWGTVLSAEENVQTQVVEAVYADGSSPPPSACPFRFNGTSIAGLGNPFGLAGNKYGWMVELDPQRPHRPAIKHSWLGRFRHEAVAVRANPGEPLVVYSACDRHGGHLYRFVSNEAIRDPKDPSNSHLLEAGRLEVAQLDSDGSGRWLLLAPETAVAPQPPSHYEQIGGAGFITLPHSDRSQPGSERIESDEQLERYCQRYRTLADLYPGEGMRQMGAILIDAHLAANAIGATPTARPEDTEIDPRTGDLLIAFTMGGSDEGGRADPAVFRGPSGEKAWPYGWVMRLTDSPVQEGRPGGKFHWRMAATGGPPWEGGLGFANPDNLAIDRSGNVWMVTDRSSSDSQMDLFGNNACWLLPRDGGGDQEALLFASGPMECELTGPCFDSDESTLFLAVQHPGEEHGSHRPGEAEMQAFQLRDREGNRFEQLRTVPLGSNWPSGVPGRPPRPAVVSIRRQTGGPLLPQD
jgi:secreted PhoX family phosphatase